MKRYGRVAIIATPETRRPVWWVGSSRKDIRAFPDSVRYLFGRALQVVQEGGIPAGAKPLKGFPTARVFEISADELRGTYRLVYFVIADRAVVVLHAFQKKSRAGRQTPLHHIRLIKERLQRAEQEHESETKSKRSRQD